MVQAPNLPTLRWEQRQRLILIEARIIWADSLSTADLRDAFGISRSQATKDIQLYQTLAPGNLEYNTRARRYCAADSFAPVFLSGTSKEFLRALRLMGPADAVRDGPPTAVAAADTPVALVDVPEREFDVSALQRVNRAIRLGRQMVVDYQSMRVDTPRALTLSPHALVHTGMRWHVRAYSRTHASFIDVLLSRMRGVPRVLQAAGEPAERDWEWRTLVSVRVGAHPGLSAFQQRVIEDDYGMASGVLERRMRVALVPYYLRALGVGAGDRDRAPEKQQIALLNPEELTDLDRLAPG